MASTNNRIFYAVQAVGLDGSDPATPNPTGITWLKGVQSVGITTNFNLEQLFELGQLAVYQNIENVPEIEVTLEKVLDGNGTIYLTAAGNGSTDIVKASNQTAGLYLIIYDNNHTSASGTDAIGVVWCSGMRPSNVSYKFPVEGNSTESVTLVGNDKAWQASTSGYGAASGIAFPDISNTGAYQSPNTVAFRRQHFIPASSYIPAEVMSAVGSGKIQNITITADIRRENLFQLGLYRPYLKYANFPITITSDFEVISANGDQVSAVSSGYNLPDTNPIKVYFNNGTASITVDAGIRNKLTSVNYTGGDTGGGNATVTYSYQGFNYFKVVTG
jgi:hypothetical protein